MLKRHMFLCFVLSLCTFSGAAQAAAPVQQGNLVNATPAVRQDVLSVNGELAQTVPAQPESPVEAATPSNSDTVTEKNTSTALESTKTAPEVLSEQTVSSGQVDLSSLLSQLETLQSQMQHLQGELEVQSHQLQRLEKAQPSSQNNATQQAASGNVTSTANTPVAAQQPFALTGLPAAETATMPSSASTAKKTSATTQMLVSGENINAEARTTSAQTGAAAVAETANNMTNPLNNNSASSSAEGALYQSAYQALLDKNYAVAKKNLQAYVGQYPKGIYAANAYYWLGELALTEGNQDAARQSFQAVYDQFPKSTKAPDALLKIGFIYYQQNKRDDAAKVLKALIATYPDTPAAQVAEKHLADINAGH